MPTPEVLSRRLSKSATNGKKLQAYEEYLRLVLCEPLWSAENPASMRIPWRLGAQAARHPALAAAFDSPGLYLFGSGAGVPLYWGKTEKQTLWKRLRSRYIGGSASGKVQQCRLAAAHEADLKARGIAVFPEHMRKNYLRRCEGAVAFAQAGIEGIWFTVLPIASVDLISAFEQNLIRVTKEWNRSHGHAPLLNRQHV